MPSDWSPDSTPYTPLQHYYADAPWRVVVVCICLNMTSRRTVGPLLDGLFDRWPTPYDMACARIDLIEEYLQALGFTKQRPRILKQMSQFWFMSWGNDGAPTTREEIKALPGCGEYAADAVSIFCWGHNPATVDDRVLREWISRGSSDL